MIHSAGLMDLEVSGEEFRSEGGEDSLKRWNFSELNVDSPLATNIPMLYVGQNARE